MYHKLKSMFRSSSSKKKKKYLEDTTSVSTSSSSSSKVDSDFAPKTSTSEQIDKSENKVDSNFPPKTSNVDKHEQENQTECAYISLVKWYQEVHKMKSLLLQNSSASSISEMSVASPSVIEDNPSKKKLNISNSGFRMPVQVRQTVPRPVDDQKIQRELAEFVQHYPELRTQIRVLLANNVIIYVLGTNHADPQCPVDTSRMMDRIQPNLCMVELCVWRTCPCPIHAGNVFQVRPEFTFRYFRKTVRQIGFLPAMIFFTDAFSERVAIEGEPTMVGSADRRNSNSFIDYGGEFAVAAQKCMKQQERSKSECRLVLADRDIPITIRRQAAAMSNWRGLKITFYVTMALIRKRRLSRYLRRGHDLVMQDPSFFSVVVIERDLYLTYMMQAAAIASLSFDVENPQIVSVVGMGHLPGIQAYWGKVKPEILPYLINDRN